MKRLDLRDIDFRDHDIIALAKCIRKVDNLTIGNFYINFVTVKGIRAISDEISKRDNPVSAKYSEI